MMNNIFLTQLQISRMHSYRMQNKLRKRYSTERYIPDGMLSTVLYKEQYYNKCFIRVIKVWLKNATGAFFAQVQTEGTRTISREVEFFNLDAIISIGYRVNSKRATVFRQWATSFLRDFDKMVKMSVK